MYTLCTQPHTLNLLLLYLEESRLFYHFHFCISESFSTSTLIFQVFHSTSLAFSVSTVHIWYIENEMLLIWAKIVLFFFFFPRILNMIPFCPRYSHLWILIGTSEKKTFVYWWEGSKPHPHTSQIIRQWNHCFSVQWAVIA